MAKDIVFDITTYFDYLISKADHQQMEMDRQRFNSNFKLNKVRPSVSRSHWLHGKCLTATM